jgi:hypothetical protein
LGALRRCSEVKIRGEEPPGNRAFGRHKHWNSQKNMKNQCPERTETPHLRSTIKLNSKEQKAQSDAKISFSLNSIKNPYNHGGLRPPSLF